MFLWIPGLEAWRSGVKLGFFPSSILSGEGRFVRSTKVGQWVDLPSLGSDFCFREFNDRKHIGLTPGELARQLGYRLKEEPPAGTLRTVRSLWNLYGVERRAAVKSSESNRSLVLRFPSSEKALPLIREILRIENAGELRFCREANRFWLRTDSLSRFTALAIEQGDFPQATLFVEHAPNLWVEDGFAHPLEQVMAFPPSVLTLVDGKNEVSILEEKAFHPLFAAAQWNIEPPWEHAVRSVDTEPLIDIPLKLVERTQGTDASVPDLWVVDAKELPHLCRWMEVASPEVRQAFRFAVLADDSQGTGETTLLYRFREVMQSALGEIPGKPYRQAKQLAGLFLPDRTKIQPDPGPVYLRKLVGMERLDRMVWIEELASGKLLPHVFSANALSGWETVVRFSLEKNQLAWRAWTKTFCFAWEITPEVMEPIAVVPPPEKTDQAHPEPLFKQEPTAKANQATPGSRAGRAKTRDKKIEPKTPPPDEGLFAKEEAKPISSQAAPDPRISRRLLVEFDASPLDWADPERFDRLRELALAWQRESQPIWAGKAWLMAAWNQGVVPWDAEVGLGLLRAWHRAEAQLRGLPPEPDLPALARQAASPEFRLNQLGWFLTGLILCSLRESKKEGNAGRETGLVQEHYRGLQTALIDHGPAGSQRLLFHAWNQLALIQADRLIATRGAERQRFSLLEIGLNLKEEWPGPLLGRRSNGGDARNQLEALNFLLERTTGWLESHGQNDQSCMTMAMVRWCFAYGMARLGAGEKARELAAMATRKMAAGELPPLVAEAYAFRVEQALTGKPASGPLPAEWLTRVGRLEGLKAFPLDYTREMSHILEPHQSVQPFASALGIGQESWGEILAARGSDSAALGRLCLERAESLRHAEPVQAASGWLDLLDRILLLPSAEARAILDVLFELHPLVPSKLASEKATRAPLPGSDLRLAVRALIASSFFQHRAEECYQAILPMLEGREQLAGWTGVPGATGAATSSKSLGMNKELFLFCSRRLALLAQMDRKSWLAPILASLAQGLEKLGQTPHAAHGRFLVDAARLRFLPTADDRPVWHRLEQQLRAESQQLAGMTLRRNEPWQAHVNKLVAYIQAAGARGPEWAMEKLSGLFEWIVPLKDYFATNPALAGRGADAHRAGVLAYQRNQVECIESMVLALAESTEATVSLWARRDEALIRTRIVESLDADRTELNRMADWNRELSL